MAATATPAPPAAAPGDGGPKPPVRRRRSFRPNVFGGSAGGLWLLVVMVPIYWIVVTSFKSQTVYYSDNPMALPSDPTLENYRMVLESDFVRYFGNSVVVTAGTVVPAVLISFTAAYAIVRGSANSRFLRMTNTLFLMGLAIPLQATIIPVYLMIIRMHMYDTLTALTLPSIAFAIPLSVLVLSNFVRDVPRELFEAMRMDGCGEWATLWRLAFPLTRPALVTVAIYDGLQVWNSFLLPLILTQSPDKRTLPLALWSFQGQYSVNVPAVLASVVLTTLPVLVLYVVGRRQLVAGLTAGFTK